MKDEKIMIILARMIIISECDNTKRDVLYYLQDSLICLTTMNAWGHVPRGTRIIVQVQHMIPWRWSTTNQ